MKPDFDLAILGSGFGGSLLASIARQIGLSVLLLERGQHPRFVMGESTTPLSNLVWSDLTAYFDLKELTPLAKWGSWQEHCPRLAVGLKRGFTFYHHETGHPFVEQPDRANELLVAASRSDHEADTHWYRRDFDAHLVACARARNTEFLERVTVHDVEFTGDTVRLGFQSDGRERHARVRFVVDASGPRGALFTVLGLPEQTADLLPKTQGLYTHFHGVRRWDSFRSPAEAPPYPVDDAAMHHVFPEGWIWVLRFNNGITSAGVSCRDDFARTLQLEEGAPAWNRLLQRLPSIRDQFDGAMIDFPWIHAPKLAFRSALAAGERWALLPSAAGFIDPLLSTGFPLTLLGIERLARLFEQDWGRPRFDDHLKEYAKRTTTELDRAQELIAALQSTMGDFPTFVRLSLLYFAAAAFTENARRRHQPEAAGNTFLLGEHPSFGPGLREICQRTIALYADGIPPAPERKRLLQEIDAVLDPVDLGQLSRTDRRNWHPLISSDAQE
jgi:tetracycline 7-halogenase / FADH2 O2-dependent halogenase